MTTMVTNNEQASAERLEAERSYTYPELEMETTWPVGTFVRALFADGESHYGVIIEPDDPSRPPASTLTRPGRAVTHNDASGFRTHTGLVRARTPFETGWHKATYADLPEAHREPLLQEIAGVLGRAAVRDERMSGELMAARRDLDAFKEKVVDVARTYGERHNMCEVLAEALQELDLEIDREVEIRYTGTVTVTLPWGVEPSDGSEDTIVEAIVADVRAGYAQTEENE